MGRKEQNDADEMMQTAGVQAVGPLLEMLSVLNAPRHYPPIYHALTTLLPQMKASDASLLHAGQRNTLNRLLTGYGTAAVRPSYIEAFMLAALKALEQVGDATSLPTVQRLADANPRIGRMEHIR